MKQLVIVIAALSGGITGCRGEQDSELTATQANDALAEMISSLEADEFNFPAERFKNADFVQDGDKVHWAGFSINLKTRKYKYQIARGKPGSKLSYFSEWVGEFEFKNGKWVATKPELRAMT
jgi:hypothetical protein